MVLRRDPVAHILNSLLMAMARYGVDRVSMTDVALEAGISRATLYRYFSTKDEVLAALGTHVLDDLRAALKHVTETERAGSDRIHTVVKRLATFIEERPTLERLSAEEPAFVIAFLRSNRPEIVGAIEEAIAPAFNEDANRRRRGRNTAIVSELIFRLMLSYQLAGKDPDSVTPAQTASVLNAYIEAQSAR